MVLVPTWLLLLALGASPVVDSDGWEVLRQTAKEFAVKDLAGRPLRSSDLLGKIVVIDFWATWCTPCLKELPELAAWNTRLQGRTDIAFLSLNVTEERDVVQAFVKKKSIGYPVYLGDALIGPYDVNAFPTKLVVDMRGTNRGVVRFRRDGYTEVRSIEAKVRQLLDERPPTPSP
jgi:thiol-disulfide isomerase/thioredoxin